MCPMVLQQIHPECMRCALLSMGCGRCRDGVHGGLWWHRHPRSPQPRGRPTVPGCALTPTLLVQCEKCTPLRGILKAWRVAVSTGQFEHSVLPVELGCLRQSRQKRTPGACEGCPSTLSHTQAEGYYICIKKLALFLFCARVRGWRCWSLPYPSLFELGVRHFADMLCTTQAYGKGLRVLRRRCQTRRR